MKTSRRLTRGVILTLMVLCMVLQGVVPIIPMAAEDTEVVKVTDLRVEYVINPIGIDVEKPRFSWILESETRNVKQTSYRILVAESEAALASGPYAWDSGIQTTDDTIGITYAGTVLKPTTRYFWTVAVQTNKGAAVTDTGAFWETGFFDTTMAAWNGAEWISKPSYVVPAWEDISTYTIEYDFKLAPGSSGFGFIFGTPADNSGARLTWQITIDAEGVPYLRPNTNEASGVPRINVSNVIPNTAEGKASWYTMRIVAVGSSGQTSLTTYIGRANAESLTEVSKNNTAGSWLLGKLGFYMNPSIDDAWFTNFKVWNNSTVPYTNNSAANLVYSEDFSKGSNEMFPDFNTDQESGRDCIRVNSSKIVGPVPFVAVHSAGAFGTNSESASNILVDNQSNKWCQTNVTASNAWFIMDAGKPIYAPSYAIRGANDDASYTSRYLHTWTVQGGNDPAGPWTTISSPGAQGTGWSGNYHLRTFSFDNPVYSAENPYRYYRLQITRYGNSANGTALGTSSVTLQFSYFGLVDVTTYMGSRLVMYPVRPAGIDNEPLYRKEFTTKDQTITKARLYATAKGYYEFAINGKKVGDQYFAPGWSDYFYTIMYQTYDVTDMLKKGGLNAIGAMTGKGWYSGPHQMMSGNNYNMYGDTQSVMGKLVVTYADGTQDVIVTDGTWKYAGGPIMYADNYRGEGYDARLDCKGWNDVGYNDSAWIAPRIIAFGPTLSSINSRNPQIIGQVEPPIREVNRFKPVEVTPASYPLLRTWNVGQNLSGILSIKVKGRAGDRITIKHAEMLNTTTSYREGGVTRGGGDGPIGTIYRASLRDQYAGGSPVAVDTYILKGDPEGEQWTPRFTFHGFQYFEITGNNVDITPQNKDRFEILDIDVIAISSDNEMLSAFESSHAKVNKLYSNVVWGMLSNHVGVPTDCPNRDERLGYTGDTQIFSHTATYLQNTVQFYSRWLRDLRDYQSSQTGTVAGLVPTLIPNNPRNTSNFSAQWSNAWGDAATIVPWHMYQMYGDEKIIWDSYASMKAWCDFLMNNNRTATGTYLRNNSGATRDNNYGDWVAIPEDLPADYKRLTNSLFMAYSHSIFAKMARAIGDPYGDAAAYEETVRLIVNAIKARYLSADGRLVHTGGTTQEKQTAYAMMICFGLDKENNAKYAQRLSELIYGNGGRLTSGFIGIAYLSPALSNNGFPETAYTLLEQEEYPSWIYSINQGATTTWERWNSYTVSSGFGPTGMNSFNHYAFGSIGEWLMSGVLGIDRDESNPDNAGFKKFILNPQYGGTLSYAKGHYDSVSGQIKSDWVWNDNGKFEYKFTIPANTKATVYIPSISAQSAVLEGIVDASAAEGVTFIKYDAVNQRAVYEVASGSYSFTSTTKATSKKLNVTTDRVTNLYGGRITASIVGSDEPAQTRVLTASAAASFALPFGSEVKLTAVPTNPAEFAFTGWIDSEGKIISTRNITTVFIGGDVTLKATFARNVTLPNALSGSTITTSNEHQNSGEWARANLVNGNLIGVSGDNGWSSNDTGQSPATSRQPVITFNMGSQKSFNRIQLYPRTDSLAPNGESGHFPVRFTIQVANNSSFTNAVTVVDYSVAYLPQPLVGEPAVFALDQTYTYQYMRITGLEMGTRPSDDTVYRMQFKQVAAYDWPPPDNLGIVRGAVSGNVVTTVKVNTETPEDAILYLAAYNASGKMTKIESFSPTMPISWDVTTNFDFSGAASVKAFLWDKNTMVPMAESKKIFG